MLNAPVRSMSETEVCKAVVFPVDDYWLALPLSRIIQVINSPKEFSTKLHKAGLVHLGSQVLTIINLHQKLEVPLEHYTEKSGSFLIVLQLNPGQLFGIPVDDPPALLELPLAKIRTLPEVYRQSTTLKIASHVILFPEDPPLEIFLLDLEQLYSE